MDLHEEQNEEKDDDIATKVSLVGSLSILVVFLMSTVAGIMADKITIRATVFIGGLLASLGMVLSSIFVKNVIT